MKFIDNIPQIGTIQWIGLRPARRAPVEVVATAEIEDRGLQGDFFRGAVAAPRAVTLIQAEHLAVIASILGRDTIDPALLRRNIVVSGINLQSLKQKGFQIGSAILFGTGNCAPCQLMEEQLGPGGFNAMRGHGGITAKVIQPGKIAIGNEVRVVKMPVEQQG
jgi:MOSC domain-containing protein YiiM